MVLEKLEVSKNASYEARPGEYSGKARFTGQHGAVEIPLDHELSVEVLKLISTSMQRTAKDFGNLIAADIVAQAPALEAPHD